MRAYAVLFALLNPSMQIKSFVKKVNTEKRDCPPPSFLKKVFRKVSDAEGRVLDPFECGSLKVLESLRLY